MNIVDIIILFFLAMGAVVGFKKGIIENIVSFVGTIIVIVISFALKNKIAIIMYTYLPFFKVGMPIINILIYEALAFLLVFSLLSVLLKILIKISGIIEKFLDFTIVLAIPSKIMGAIFGFLEMYLFIFVILFSLAAFNFNNSYITDSKIGDFMITHTPFISKGLESTYKAIKEVIQLNKDYKESQEQDLLEEKGIKILLDYNIITKENLNTLIGKGKIKPITNERGD